MQVEIKNINQELISFSGVKLLEEVNKESGRETIPLTLKSVFITAMMSADNKETYIEKLRNGELAKKIYNHKDEDISLSVEEVNILEKRIGIFFPTITVVTVHDILNQQK